MNIDWKPNNNTLNTNQELMEIIHSCVSYLNIEIQKRSELLNGAGLIDTLNYVVDECQSHYSKMELPNHDYSRAYKLNQLAQHIKEEHIWGYVRIGGEK